MNTQKIKTPRSDNKSKGQFKTEAEFVAAEKRRFDEVFGHVNWATIKDK